VSTFGTLLMLPPIFGIVIGNRKFDSPSLDPDDEASQHFDPEGASENQVSASHNKPQEPPHEK
jgi:hypothetical protein